MATATPVTTDSDRREFLIRHQTLIFDEGTQVLRNILDKRLQNQPLNVVLESERSTIEQLQRQNTITTAQIDSLYPGRGQLPDTSNFDITLIVCLIRHLHSLGCNQNYNWNVPPQTGDTSVEADVCRLKGFRNEIAHISSTTAFQYSSFETKWNEIKTVLLRLDQQSPTPNFSQRIDSYKYSPMDPANDINLNMEKFDENKDSELFDFGLYDRSEDDDESDAGELSMPLDLSCGSMDLSGVLEEPLTSTPAKSEKPKSKLTCDQCGNTYKTKYGLNIHRMKHTGHFKHVCVICNQGFGQTKQFKSHVASHNKLAVSKCDDCGKSFTGHSSLRRHTLVCGKKNVTSEFYCDQCALEVSESTPAWKTPRT